MGGWLVGWVVRQRPESLCLVGFRTIDKNISLGPAAQDTMPICSIWTSYPEHQALGPDGAFFSMALNIKAVHSTSYKLYLYNIHSVIGLFIFLLLVWCVW